MQIITKNIAELKSPEKNVRLHGNRQIKEYIRSIEMFGQVRPLVIDENNVVLCGNGLLQALQQMNCSTADCLVVKNLSERQKKKLMLTDNKIFELGANNIEVFDEILRELNGDIDIPGYDEELLKVLTASANKADEILNDYGNFSEEKIIQMNNAEIKPPTVSTPTPQTAIQPSVTSESPIQSAVVQNNSRFVVCPKCGEKIWL